MISYLLDLIYLLLNDARLDATMVKWIANILSALTALLFWFILLGLPLFIFYKCFKMIYNAIIEKKEKIKTKKRK